MLQRPPHQQLSRSTSIFLAQLYDCGVIHAQSSREGRVGFDDDVVGLAVGCYGVSGVEGVDFDLVYGGFEAGGGGKEFVDLMGGLVLRGV